MSSDAAAAFDAAGSVLARSRGVAAWELACKRSEGEALARRSGEREQSEAWTEEALALRVELDDGRSALASAAGWDDAAALARLALGDARRGAAPCAAGPPFAEPWEGALPAALAPPPRSDAGAVLDAVLAAAREADERCGGLELGRLRRARVSTELFGSNGLVLRVDQDLAQLEAELIGRQLSKHAGCADTLVAPVVDEAAAAELGRRLGRALRRQLDGVPRAPSGGGLLLAREAVGELSFRLAPVLVGLIGRPAGAEPPRCAAGLRLREDACEDEAARSLPVDGIGRRLEPLDLVVDERLVVPPRARLPWLRPGIADPPQQGWLRLSWSAEEGLSDEALVERLGAGLLVERLVTREVDPGLQRWRGDAEGWWVEDGVGKRAVARLPLTLELPALLPALEAAGSEPRSAHASGTIRAVAWLLGEAGAAR